MTKPLGEAVRVARMYYYGERTTQEIAEELGVSRSRVSRLLKLAKEEGLVEIRIVDPGVQAQQVGLSDSREVLEARIAGKREGACGRTADPNREAAA